MTEYTVVWRVELDADNETAAAVLAREYVTDPDSIAHVYEVTDPDGAMVTIDLDYDPDGLKPLTIRGAIAMLDSTRDRLYASAPEVMGCDRDGCNTCAAVSLITGRLEQLQTEVTA